MYDKNTKLPSNRDYYLEAIEEIEATSISSQVYQKLKEKGQLEKTPLFFQVRLKQKYEETVFQNLFIKNQTDKLLEECEKGKIEVIPLKGVYFSQEYFGHLGARGTSDIDVLVKRESVEKTIKLVESLGYNQAERFIPGHFHCSFSKCIPGSSNPLTVEIHWNVVKTATSRFKIQELWEDSREVPGRTYVKRLSNQYLFYMICLHGWRHNLDSPKYYLDIIQLIYKFGKQLDIPQLFLDARRHGTYKRLVRTLSIVYGEFPILENMMKLPTKQKKRGRVNRYWDFIDYQFLSYDSFLHSLKEVHQWLFPAKVDIYIELNLPEKNQCYLKSLYFLYKKRVSKFTKVVTLSLRGE
ncbi:nucleotidyltransferase family protein [Pseudalkalibacillus caeni]|uniref:nucleotidyltransferase family protein n=1 Tax=Exobacillus caeni TaxID=2574798 RepID=UPI001484D349|nr:nucleotidyltransferase family protein [Pseudalkalibacillus caeni]